MNARVFVDTNVFVYAFDGTEPEKQRLAIEVLERETRDSELVVSTQVLQELYVALTRGRDPIATPEVARAAVEAAAEYTMVPVDPALVLNAIAVSQRAQLSFWDGLIVAAAAAGGCKRLLSEDLNTGQVIDGVQIENPLRR